MDDRLTILYDGDRAEDALVLTDRGLICRHHREAEGLKVGLELLDCGSGMRRQAEELDIGFPSEFTELLHLGNHIDGLALPGRSHADFELHEGLLHRQIDEG